MATRLPFSAGGLDGAFTALVGTVIATERNSDSVVRGGGGTTSVNGQVSGPRTSRRTWSCPATSGCATRRDRSTTGT